MEDEKDPDRLLQDSREFHLAVAQVSGNPLIRLTVHSLFKMHGILSAKAGYPARLAKGIHGRHERIVDAIEARDPELCVQLMAADAKKHEKVMVASAKKNKS